MKVKAFMLASVLLGQSQMANADHMFKISADALDLMSYVKVAEIRVNGVTADSVEEVSVPNGADVTVVFKNGRGYVWGNDTAVYSNVTSDVTISELPKTLRSYLGDVNCPILVENVEDLIRVRDLCNSGNTFKRVYFKQTADLDMSESGPWVEIGKGTTFQGIYDGGEHRIYNLTLANGLRKGLFGYVASTTIKNLTVHFLGFANPQRDSCGGAIAANPYQDVTFTHVIAEGTLSDVRRPTAGIAVQADRVRMFGCTNRVNITGTASEIGGLAASCGRVTSSENRGLSCVDCANEGRIENLSTVNAAGGLVGKVMDEHLLKFIRCRNSGEIVAKNKGSLVGCYETSSKTVINSIDAVAQASLSPVGLIKEGVCTISGLNFAKVSSGIASFCDTPTTDGAFQVMLENADPIVLADVELGDQLILDGYEKYSGTVTCADAALSVKGRDGVWTVTKRMSVDAGSLVEGDEPGVYELEPAANQVSALIDGFEGELLKIPGTIQFIRGVASSQLSVANGGYDVTPAVSFDGDEENGYALTLDGSAVVNGVKVTPTIGEGLSDAFTVANGTRIRIRSVPGLWYGLYRGETPDSIDDLCSVKLAESDTIALSDALTPVPNAFYRIKVFLSSPVKD